MQAGFGKIALFPHDFRLHLIIIRSIIFLKLFLFFLCNSPFFGFFRGCIFIPSLIDRSISLLIYFTSPIRFFFKDNLKRLSLRGM